MEEGEARHFCPNYLHCPPQIKGRIEHYIHRKALNIDGLGQETVDLFFQKGFLRSPADLYDLKPEMLEGLEGFGEKSINNIMASIEESKNVVFQRVLFGLGIRFVGETVAKRLAKVFKSMDNIQKATREELLEVNDIGERIADSIISYFQQEENLDIISRLEEAGINMEIEETEDLLTGVGYLADGGAAMTAYMKMQFTNMPAVEEDALIQGLLRY